MIITDEQVRAACDIAALVYAGTLKRSQGIRVLADEHGINAASAGDFIADYRYLMQGRLFHRSMSAAAMRYFFEQIAARHGDSGLRNAVGALRAHYQALRRENRLAHAAHAIGCGRLFSSVRGTAVMEDIRHT